MTARRSPEEQIRLLAEDSLGLVLVLGRQISAMEAEARTLEEHIRQLRASIGIYEEVLRRTQQRSHVSWTAAPAVTPTA